MQSNTQARIEEQPTRRDVELDHLLEEVAEDAHERAEHYSEETAVPEGGE